jgi:pimeloyl-ACP methyl ester carboxylesterase
VTSDQWKNAPRGLRSAGDERCSYYFRNVIQALTGSGYRVVAPDQLGWGKSPKPDIHSSFQLLAADTAALLDHLGVGRIAVLGHSTGGMTAARFTLMHPDVALIDLLTPLSFCPVFLDDVLKIDAVTAAVNYGVNKVRFPAPVPVGSRVRGHVRLVSAEQKQAGLECAFGVLVELEGSDRPACVIETVVIYR